MSEPTSYDLPTFDLSSGDPPVHLKLHRYIPKGVDDSRPRKPVLLLHGASASHKTFLNPGGGLAAWLAQHDFDPWLLDWRGSGCVVDEPRNFESLRKTGEIYNFNLAAKHDIPAAIEKVRSVRGQDKISVLGFCMGGAILAESVALRHITEDHVDNVVLMALGLFYEATVDGRVKCEDRILEELKQKFRSGGDFEPWIDPRMGKNKLSLKTPWHEDLDGLYNVWPGALKSHAELPDPEEAVNRMCNRLSFMYGMPYHHHNLVSGIHGSEGKEGLLPDLFGAIPLDMFIHGAQNIRKGHATFYDRSGQEDRFLSREAHDNFRSLTSVTLITGALNRLWHRNSIDLMHEWLCRGTADHLRKFKKHVIPGYAHQDLLWGQDSGDAVFPKIKAALEADAYVDKALSAS